MFVTGKSFQLSVMQHCNLLGSFLSYEENEVLWILLQFLVWTRQEKQKADNDKGQISMSNSWNIFTPMFTLVRSYILVIALIHEGIQLVGDLVSMEQRTLKNVNRSLNTNIYSYSETSGGQSSSLFFNVAHFFSTSVN